MQGGRLSGEKWWIAIARIVLGHTIVTAARAHNWPRPTWHIVPRAKSLIYQMIRWPAQKLRNKKLLIFSWSSNQRKNLSALTNSTLTLQQCDVIWANADNSVLLSAPKRPRSPPKIYLSCSDVTAGSWFLLNATPVLIHLAYELNEIDFNSGIVFALPKN